MITIHIRVCLVVVCVNFFFFYPSPLYAFYSIVAYSLILSGLGDPGGAVRLCAYTRTYIHTYIHTCIHAYMHTCIHAYMHTCIHAYMHTCIHACTYIYICVCVCVGLSIWRWLMYHTILNPTISASVSFFYRSRS